MAFERIALLSAGIGSLPGLVAAQAPSDRFALPLYAPAGPYDAVLRDFDGDGLLDVAVAQLETTLLRGRTDGSFDEPLPLPSSHICVDLDSADFDHDGVPDVVGVRWDDGIASSVVVFLGRGDGRFEPPIATSIDLPPTQLALGDVDGDGECDVLVNLVWGWGGGARLLLGRGDGTLDPPIALPIVDQLESPQLADLDCDGHLDLGAVVGEYSAPDWHYFLQTYLGHGDGSFAPAVRTPVDARPAFVRFHDFDVDGRLDAVLSVGSWTHSSPVYAVELLRGLAGGTFDAATTLWSGAQVGPVAIADLDGDARVDLSVPHGRFATLTGGGIALLRGSGGLVFSAAEETPTVSGARFCFAGDLEGDGDVDLVTVNDLFACGVGIVRALSPGEFDVGDASIATSEQTVDVAAGDVDGDGAIDLVDVHTNQVEWRRGLGHGRFAPPQSASASTTLRCVKLGDFNADGRADVAAIETYFHPDSAPLAVWISTPQGLGQRQEYDLGAAYQNHALDAGDLDGDGRDDLAVAVDANVHILHSRPDGSFEETSTVAMSMYCCGERELEIGDYDGDGLADVAMITLDYEPILRVAHGVGGGQFGSAVRAALRDPIVLLASGDLDLDGADDLLVLDGDKVLHVLFGRADQSFDYQRLPDPCIVVSAAVADVNGNGMPDLIGVQDESLLVFTGDGARGFDRPRGYCTGPVGRCAVADLDGDGDLDVVATTYHALKVLLQR